MSSDDTKISAVVILDVIGRPPEHLVETLEGIIKEIDNEKGVVVKSKNVKEPVLMKDQKEFYTTFAEIEVEVDEVLYLAVLLFKYMPAHIEIVSPEIIALSNGGWNDVFNELTSRLHAYDEVARITQVEKNILLKKIQELLGKAQEQKTEETPTTARSDEVVSKETPKGKQKKK